MCWNGSKLISRDRRDSISIRSSRRWEQRAHLLGIKSDDERGNIDDLLSDSARRKRGQNDVERVRNGARTECVVVG